MNNTYMSDEEFDGITREVHQQNADRLKHGDVELDLEQIKNEIRQKKIPTYSDAEQVELRANLAIIFAQQMYEHYVDRGYHSRAEHVAQITDSLTELLEYYKQYRNLL